MSDDESKNSSSTPAAFGGYQERGGAPEQIPSFKSTAWGRVKGRGWIAGVRCDRKRERYDTGLIGQVEIDGEIFECIGCQVFATGTHLHEGEAIGLLVREVR